MSDTIKVEIPTWTDMSKTHKVWIKELQAYFAAIGQHRILDKSKAPTMPDAEFPEVTTQEAFIARVTKHPRASDLVAMAGYSGVVARFGLQWIHGSSRSGASTDQEPV